MVGDVGKVGAGRVGDGGGQRALALRFGQNAHDVGAFTALRDAEDERLAEPWRRFVDTEEAGRGEGHRQLVGRAEHVLRIASGVIAGAAGGDEDVINAAVAHGGGQGDHGGSLAGQQAAHDLGLFMDFVVHVG